MGHASADDAEYERLKRQNSAVGYSGTGFGLNDNEQAVCCINIGTVTQHKTKRVRPPVASYVSSL